MKKLLAALLAVSLLLCGCSGKEEAPSAPAETAAASTSHTGEETTVPAETAAEESTADEETEPEVFRNPLTGQKLDAPMTTRVFGVSIGNTKESLPHYGVSMADVLFETYVNGLTTRRFALYSDISKVGSIGGVRSMRMPFTDMTQAYDAIAVYAAGSDEVLNDLSNSGIDGILATQWGEDYYYRDQTRLDSGYAYEHCLMVKGAELVAFAEKQGCDITQAADKDYGLRFAENAVPQGGEGAEVVTVGFCLSGSTKETVLTYLEEYGVYSLSQYGVECSDGYYYAMETFTNVFVLLCENVNHGQYHVATTIGEGDGYFACGGQLIPIRWHRADEDSPFTFTHTDGTQLLQGIGRSYIALAPIGSYVNCSAAG